MGTDSTFAKLLFEHQKENIPTNYKSFGKKIMLGLGRPTSIPVFLYGDNLKIDVVVFDVSKMLLSSFNDSNLNKIENLVVNNQNRFSKYISPDGLLGDVNTGMWYHNAYTH